MLALSSLVLATTLLSTPGARAGSWVFTGTGSGTNTLTFGYPGMSPRITHWTPPGPQTGRFDLGSTLGDSSDYSVSDTATLTVTVTATWQADPNFPSDPAPPKVWLCESAQANWSEGQSGSAADGLSDPYQAKVPGLGGASSSDTAPAAVPPAYWTLKTVSGGTVTLPARTLTAEADFSPTTTRPYGDFCTAHITSYSVTIHPQPYNWHITSVIDNGDGTLSFEYNWLSTSGSKANLTTCFEHEYVTYDGPVGTAEFPLYYTMPAPFSGQLRNPTVLPGVGPYGNPMTAPEIPDDQNMPALSPFPHVTGSFTGTQKYEFDDTATGETDTVIPGPDSGPLSIVRSVYSQDGVLWYYKVTKSGHTATKSI